MEWGILIVGLILLWSIPVLEWCEKRGFFTPQIRIPAKPKTKYDIERWL